MRFVEGDPALQELPKDYLVPNRLSRSLLRAQLGTPLALGVQFPEQPAIYPEEIRSSKTVAAAIEYLKHGLLYCHFYVGGSYPASGENGPIAKMYPITPIEIGPGWVIGIERVVTTKSGSFFVSGEEKPNLFYFTLAGAQLQRETELHRSRSGWVARITLRDGEEMAIIEAVGNDVSDTYGLA